MFRLGGGWGVGKINLKGIDRRENEGGSDVCTTAYLRLEGD